MSHLLRATTVAQPDLHRQVGDAQVLGGHALGGVADDDRDVGALGRPLGAELGVVVDRAGDLACGAAARRCRPGRTSRPSNSSSVSIASRVVPAISETITRSEPRKRVHQRRLADVRPADHRDPRIGVVGSSALDVGSARRAPTSRSSRSPVPRPVGGRDRHRLAEPERVELGRERLVRLAPSTLLATTTTGFGAAQDLGDLGVARPSPARASTTSSDHVGVGDRRARLLPGPRARASRRRRGRPRPCRSARSATPFHSHSSALRSRVTPASEWTTASRPPARRLTRVLLAGVREADDGDLRDRAASCQAPLSRQRGDRATTTSSTSRPVVSTSTASSAARSAPCSRSGSRASRSRCAASTSAASSPVSAARRRARSSVVGGQKDLQRRVRADDGADVPALGDVAPAAISSRWRATIASRTPGWTETARGGGGHLRRADRRAHVLAVEHDRARRRARSSRSRATLADRVGVVGVDAGAQRGQRDAAVHRPGIEVGEAERVGERPGNG